MQLMHQQSNIPAQNFSPSHYPINSTTLTTAPEIFKKRAAMSKEENTMAALSLRVWKGLGVVDTIFEEEGEDPSTTPSVSPLLSPSPTTPLHSLVEAWYTAD